MDNIILIGMAGCGKSTVGVLLAKMLGYDFIDSDLLIQKSAGKKIYEILRDDGNDYFTDLENKINSQITAKKTVIATGGSAVFGQDAMRHLGSIGKIVYLEVPLHELKKRVTNFQTRGIVKKEDQTLEDVYNERAPLYKKYADITVSCTDCSLEQNAKKIISALNK